MYQLLFPHITTGCAIMKEVMKNKRKNLVQLISTPVRAGFPNPAEDARGIALDLNELVAKHPVSTFYLRVEGDSMTGAGIVHGDIVAVDKSLQPRSGDIVVAAVDGDFTLKHLKRDGDKAWLVPANPDYQPIALHEAVDASIWGVVTFVIHKTRI
jgi:DNA polymerase V